MRALSSLLLTLVLLASLAACGGTVPAPTMPIPEPPIADTTPALPQYGEVDVPVTFLNVSYGETVGEIRSIHVYRNEDGSVRVEYVGEEKKVGDFDANLLHGITAALASSGLLALNGQSQSGAGSALGSLYVSYADGTVRMADYYGTVPEAYRQGYGRLAAFFEEITAHLPPYQPEPIPLNEVDGALVAEAVAILRAGGITDLDTFTVSRSLLPGELGLSDVRPVADGLLCGPMMMPNPYGLTVVRLQAGAEAEEVCADFAEHLDWYRWVCVLPSNAAVAVKGDLVLCLMGTGGLYTKTLAGIEACGWEIWGTYHISSAGNRGY